MNSYFGPDWGVAATEYLNQVPTPVGEPCLYCTDAIALGDQGFIRPCFTTEGTSWRPIHKECDLRSILGSIGHLRGTCSCFGGTETDDPNLTVRQNALAVWAWVDMHQARNAV